jgi:hypothetical protein
MHLFPHLVGLAYYNGMTKLLSFSIVWNLERKFSRMHCETIVEILDCSEHCTCSYLHTHSNFSFWWLLNCQFLSSFRLFVWGSNWTGRRMICQVWKEILWCSMVIVDLCGHKSFSFNHLLFLSAQARHTQIITLTTSSFVWLNYVSWMVTCEGTRCPGQARWLVHIRHEAATRVGSVCSDGRTDGISRPRHVLPRCWKLVAPDSHCFQSFRQTSRATTKHNIAAASVYPRPRQNNTTIYRSTKAMGNFLATDYNLDLY